LRTLEFYIYDVTITDERSAKNNYKKVI
jgi:hypothetical protein